MSRTVLKLFVAGRSLQSERAIRNLRSICREALEEDLEVVIIDVLEHPNEAEVSRICASPTLLRELPPPVRRVIGDLSEAGDVIAGLGLHTSRA